MVEIVEKGGGGTSEWAYVHSLIVTTIAKTQSI